MTSAYRPRHAGHDYYGCGTYLAPWDLDAMGAVCDVPSDTDYSRFHNLNTLAAEICAFNGEAKIIRADQGTVPRS